MEKEKVIADPAQGVGMQEVTAESVQQWLKRDLSLALHVLEAVYSDPDLLAQVATFMAGRIMNHKQKLARGPLPTEPVR